MTRPFPKVIAMPAPARGTGRSRMSCPLSAMHPAGQAVGHGARFLAASAQRRPVLMHTTDTTPSQDRSRPAPSATLPHRHSQPPQLPPTGVCQPAQTPPTAGAMARNEALRTPKYLGRTIWRLWSGYTRRSRVETKIHCVKLLGQRHMARDFDRQVSKLQVRIAVLNGYTALRTPVTKAVG